MVLYGGLKRNRDEEDQINGIGGAGHGEGINGSGTDFPTAGLDINLGFSDGVDQDIDLNLGLSPAMPKQLSTAVKVQAPIAAPVMALTAAEVVATSLFLSPPAPVLPHPMFISSWTNRSPTGQRNLGFRLPMPKQLSTATGTEVRVQAPIAAPVIAATGAEAEGTSSLLSPAAPPLPQPMFFSARRNRSPVKQRNRRRPPIPAGRSEIVEQPYPWATDRHATVHNLEYLFSHSLTTISGDVHCKACKRYYKIEFNLSEKFQQVGHYIDMNKECMNERAPTTWMKPVLPICNFCQNNVKPEIKEKNETINWLFLFLGQLLGCCTMEQLKYFCKHNGHITTSAKDRLLFHTYLGIYKQLNPERC